MHDISLCRFNQCSQDIFLLICHFFCIFFCFNLNYIVLTNMKPKFKLLFKMRTLRIDVRTLASMAVFWNFLNFVQNLSDFSLKAGLTLTKSIMFCELFNFVRCQSSSNLLLVQFQILYILKCSRIKQFAFLRFCIFLLYLSLQIFKI